MSKINLFILFILLFTFGSVSASTQNFTRNLKVGDYGLDVLLLQQTLNKDVDTQISSSGVGSVGNETQFFGLKTEDAVKKFQEKYKNEILVPYNLGFATGFVGPSTIKKLEQILNEKTTSKDTKSTKKTSKTSTKETDSANTVKTPVDITKIVENGKINMDALSTLSKVNNSNAVIFFVAPAYIKQGDEVRVYSTKAQEKADIYVSGKKISKVSYNSDKGYHYFTLPKVNAGQNELWFENSGIKSNSFKISVIKNGTITPTITSAPEKIILNRENTISVDGLTNNNTVKTSFGVFTGFKKGKTELTFSPTLQTGALGVLSSFEGFLIVSNENGESEMKMLKYEYEK